MASDQDTLDQANLTRSYVPSVGVGAAGSTPQTDQTNLNVARAMEAGDNFDRGFQPQQTVSALRASRDVPDMIGNAVESRRQALAQGLANGVNPDAPAITVNPKTRQAMLQELHGLSQIAYQNSVTKAHQTAQTFKQQKDTESANDYVGFIHDLNGIDSPIGSPEHAAAASQVFENHPVALQTTAGREAAMLHARVHDTAASLGTLYGTKEAAWAENPDATLEQSPRGGWRVLKTKVTSPDAAPYGEGVKGAAKAGFTPDEFLNAKVEAGNQGPDKKFVNANDGDMIRVTVDGKEPAVMAVGKFNGIKRGLTTKTSQQQAPQPQVPVLTYDHASGKLIPK